MEHYRSFCFEAHCTAFTARKEPRPGGWYWYAYRRKHGKLHSTHLGKSEELTLERLRTVAEALERAHTHDISRDDALQVHLASNDAMPTRFTIMEQITKPESASKRLSRTLRDVEISPLQSPSSIVLTRREHEVLCLLTMGLTNVQIAERLVVSLSTINTHVRSIYNKLEVNSRTAATRYAFVHHLI